jgi:hypothetical protein
MDKKDVEDLTEDVVDVAGYEPPDYQLLAQDRKVRGKKTHWATASIKLASRASPHVELVGRLPAQRCPHCRRWIWAKTQRK